MRGTGKVIVVTGATSGIGFETVLALSRLGATVIGVGRSQERCDAAEAAIRREAGSETIRFEVADLASQADIRGLAGRLRDAPGRLDVLVNNAGTFTGRRALSPDGVEMQLAVNVLAPFLLTRELLPLLEASPEGRVVTVSSGTHFGARLSWIDFEARRRYRGLRVYGATKLAAVMWSYELARRLGQESSVGTYVVDPGLVNTDMGLKDSHPLVRLVWLVRRRGGATPAEGARTSVYIATEPDLRRESGRYWKECRAVPSSPESHDPAAARRLWEACERLCGLEP